MDDIKALVWLFPILFIFHDFEEIIFIRAWLTRNRNDLCERFPGLSKKLLGHLDHMTTSSFALGVAEEFILISIVTIVAYMMNWYNLWAGLFMAFVIHLVIHCIQALIVKRYVPALITSIICLPICFYIVMSIVQWLMLDTIIIYSILGFIIMVVNLMLVHKGMGVFSKWIEAYE